MARIEPDASANDHAFSIVSGASDSPNMTVVVLMIPPHSRQRGSASPPSTRSKISSVGHVVLADDAADSANVPVHLGDIHLWKPRFEMQPIDVLGYASAELAGPINVDQRDVGSVRLQRGSGSPKLSFRVHLPTALAPLPDLADSDRS